MGEEAVLADSGWEGETVARVGRVRSLAFLSILRLSQRVWIEIEKGGGYGRRYWYRTSGLFRVKEALYP